MNTSPQGWVFREAREARSEAELAADVAADIEAAAGATDTRPAALVRALLSAAALECATADAQAPLADVAARIADDTAAALLSARPHALATATLLSARPHALATAAAALARSAWRSDRMLATSAPEGFAYYALDPVAFAHAAVALVPASGPVLVVGVRSIGCALSAATAAAARVQQRSVWRLTVRPAGHPYDRRLTLATAELRTVNAAAAAGAHCLVVDEGPGLSGSSFLATAEALVAAGVASARITLVGSREVAPAALIARDAAARWARLRFVAVTPARTLLAHVSEALNLSGGRWRTRVLGRPKTSASNRGNATASRRNSPVPSPVCGRGTGRGSANVSGSPSSGHDRDERDNPLPNPLPQAGEGIRVPLARERPAWPPCWPAMERIKLLTKADGPAEAADAHVLRKFEGLGRYGARVHARAAALGAAGWGLAPLGPPDAGGFIAYPWCAGRPLTIADRDPAFVIHLARYLAARPQLCPAAMPAADARACFEDMLRTNVTLELPEAAAWPAPRWERPAIVDGHLMPHEWLLRDGGGIVKLDGAAHGDDHFFPGPTDIAWDLAGAIVEWQLPDDLRDLLLLTYTAACGDDPRPRLRAFVIAYAAFRARFAVLAAHASPVDDARRWRQAHAGYHAALIAALA